jgi:hypothetical protein
MGKPHQLATARRPGIWLYICHGRQAAVCHMRKQTNCCGPEGQGNGKVLVMFVCFLCSSCVYTESRSPSLLSFSSQQSNYINHHPNDQHQLHILHKQHHYHPLLPRQLFQLPSWQALEGKSAARWFSSVLLLGILRKLGLADHQLLLPLHSMTYAVSRHLDREQQKLHRWNQIGAIAPEMKLEEVVTDRFVASVQYATHPISTCVKDYIS